ncbi:MAG: YHS domain-containing (seleno)protein [Bacteroidota bacterium]
MKKSILILVFTFASIATFSQKSHINLDKTIAIQGYDPVAYFESGKPMEGKKEITANYNNAVYQFTSEQNKALFLKNPSYYEPQFGGFCAYGMSQGYEAPIQPEAFTIVDGKLYLNYNLKVKEMWNKNQAERIQNAEINWGKIIKQ